MSSRLWTATYTLCLLLSTPLRAADTHLAPEDAILALHKTGKLTDKGQYKTVRAAFARLFEAKHADVLRRAYGDYDGLTKWLDARPELKQNLYTALDDRLDDRKGYDNLLVALSL